MVGSPAGDLRPHPPPAAVPHRPPPLQQRLPPVAPRRAAAAAVRLPQLRRAAKPSRRRSPPRRRGAAAGVSCHGCFDGWLLYGPPGRCGILYGYSEIQKCFLTNPLTGAAMEMPLYLGDIAMTNVLYMRKFMVCSPDLIAALSGASVLFYRPGAPSWSDGGGAARESYYTDSALYRGRIYALNTNDDLFVHEVGGADRRARSQGAGPPVGGSRRGIYQEVPLPRGVVHRQAAHGEMDGSSILSPFLSCEFRRDHSGGV